MENGAEIRRRVLVDGQSERSVCREFAIHRDTRTTILDHPEPLGDHRTAPRPRPKLDPFLPLIHPIRDGDTKAPREQRPTARRIFERLRDEDGSSGGLTVIKDAVRAWRRGRAAVVVPLAHRPGEAQVDFGQAEVTRDGRTATVALFVRTVPYSDATFVSAFPRECTEAFLEGHVRAFAFFGGVPRRVSYDNSKVAVAEIIAGRGREVTAESLRLKGHHLFESHSCPVRRPTEEGHVATPIGFARRHSRVPLPAVHGGLGPLNADLEARGRTDLGRRLRGKPATEAVSPDEGRPGLIALPGEAFVAARVEHRRADSLAWVRFDATDSSVPTAYAHHRVAVVGAVDTVRLVGGDRVVATHRRRWDREQVRDDPVHSRALRERTPGALDFAEPREGRERPVCFGIRRRRLEAEFGGPGTRRFIEVLRLLGGAAPGEPTRAVERALELGTADADAVRLILEQRREQPVGLFSLDGRPHLKLVGVAAPALTASSSLTAGVAS